MGGSRQTMMHINPHHPVNSDVRERRRQKRGNSNNSKTTRSRSDVSSKASPVPTVRSTTPTTGAVQNGVPFTHFSPAGSMRVETSFGDTQEIESDNQLLKWRVKQLTSTGEIYRRKVEALYRDGKEATMDLRNQVADCKARNDDVNGVAIETASELALSIATKSTLEHKHKQLKGTLMQIRTRLSDVRIELKSKEMSRHALTLQEDKLSIKLSDIHSDNSDKKKEITNITAERRRVEKLIAEVNSEHERVTSENTRSEDLLRMWSDASQTLSSDIHNKISMLEAATQDCRRLTTMACKLTPGGEERPFSPRAFSPPPTGPSGSPEIHALKETNKRVC